MLVVDSSSHKCYQSLPSPTFQWARSDRGYLTVGLHHTPLEWLTSLMMMVPSMASCRSCRVVLTMVITRCIRSISWRRKIFMEDSAPISWSRAFTCGSVWGCGGKRMQCCLWEQVVDDPLVLPFLCPIWSSCILCQLVAATFCGWSFITWIRLRSRRCTASLCESFTHITLFLWKTQHSKGTGIGCTHPPKVC